MKLLSAVLFFSLFINCTLCGQEYTVNKFVADYFLNPDGSVNVYEKYDLFFHQPKHGIIRDFDLSNLLKNKDGKAEYKNLYYSDFKVTGSKFKKNPYYEQLYDNKLFLKIGDPDKTIEGLLSIEISYKIRNLFLFDKDKRESIFYWNVKTDDWDADFNKIIYRIHAPEGSHFSQENSFTYAGDYSQTRPSTDFVYTYSDSIYTAESNDFIRFKSGESVSSLVYLPMEIIPHNDLTAIYFRRYQWLAFLILFGFIFWFLILKRVKKEPISITSYYPPNNIDPAMAGYLINNKADTYDLIALLPKWGADGLIRIEEIGSGSKRDLILTKIGEPANPMNTYERIIFSGIFGNSGNEKKAISVNGLKKDFHSIMISAKVNLMSAAQKYFDKEAENRLSPYLFWIFIIGIGFAIISFLYYGFLAVVVGLIFFAIIFLAVLVTEIKTEEGNKIFGELKGFKNFIQKAEIRRIQELLKDDPSYFEKTMSYALAFGLLDKWAEKFDGLSIQLPEWCKIQEGNNIRSFSKSFSKNMMATSVALIGTVPSTTYKTSFRSRSGRSVSFPSRSSFSSGSRSFGGGSAGGGFGGGGGRGW